MFISKKDCIFQLTSLGVEDIAHGFPSIEYTFLTLRYTVCKIHAAHGSCFFKNVSPSVIIVSLMLEISVTNIKIGVDMAPQT